MAIKNDALRQVGITLKQRAEKESKKVNNTFIIELGNYARHIGVEELGEKDTTFVLETIGKQTLEDYGELTARGIRATIHKKCRPTTAWDLCAGTAKNILEMAGRMKAVTKIDKTLAKVMKEWDLDV
jgi:hypothetical protein